MKRRTARTIVVWIALLLLIASWFYSYSDALRTYAHVISLQIFYGINWSRLFFIDLTIIALAAGFLFTFRGGNDRYDK
jgi:hypothetical protein